MRQMAKFRNRLVHLCGEIDDDDVYEFILNNLQDILHFEAVIATRFLYRRLGPLRLSSLSRACLSRSLVHDMPALIIQPLRLRSIQARRAALCSSEASTTSMAPSISARNSSKVRSNACRVSRFAQVRLGRGTSR